MAKKSAPKKIEFPPDIKALRREKEDIEAFLASLEDAYNEGSITEESYDEMKRKNSKRLHEITEILGGGDAVEEELPKQPKEKPMEKAAPAEEERPEEEKPEAKESEIKGKLKSIVQRIPKNIFGKKSEEEKAPEKTEKKEEEKVKAKAPKKEEKKEPATAGELLEQEFRKEAPEAFQPPAQEAHVEEKKKERREDWASREEVTRLNTEIEKLRAFLEAVREMRANTDERTQRTAETVGEIRSTLYQVEGSLKEMEAKAEEHEDALAALKPRRFMEEMQDKDRRLGMLEAKMDKVEHLTETLNQDMRRLQDTMRDIGNLENIVEVSRNIAKKLLEMDNKEKSMQKLSDRIEKLFVDISEKLNEFEVYRASQDRIGEITQEMMKGIEELNVKTEKFVSRDDIDAIRADLQKSIEEVRQTMEEIPEEVRQMKEEKESINVLLDSLESEYREGAIGEEDYAKARDANLRRIKDIDEKISSTPAKPPAPEEPRVVEAGAEKAPGPRAKAPPMARSEKSDKLMLELKEMLEKGLISKEAYERSKKAFGG